MHARVVSLKVDRQGLSEAIQTYRDQVIPAALKQPGFAGLVLLLDRDAAHATSITLWDTGDALTATDLNSFYVEQVTRLGTYFAESADREDLEVAVFARGDTSSAPKFARAVRASFYSSRTDQGIQTYADGIIANARKQQGFVSALLLIERASGKALSISLWDSEDTLGGGEVSPYYIGQIFKLIPFVASLPDREQYEVAAYVDTGQPKESQE